MLMEAMLKDYHGIDLNEPIHGNMLKRAEIEGFSLFFLIKIWKNGAGGVIFAERQSRMRQTEATAYLVALGCFFIYRLS